MISWLLSRLSPSDVQQADLIVKIIGIVGAGVAFAIALLQYRRAELWRRNEFVAKEMKEFFADPRVRNALTLLDWGTRSVNLELQDKLPMHDWPVITRALQVAALFPHDTKHEWDAIAPGPRAVPDRFNESIGRYTLLEALIRDTYDAFLDGLERHAHFVEANLIKAEELQPYLRYWIEDLARIARNTDDAEWQLTLIAYIDFYEFRGTQELLRHFGHDIRPGGDVWNRLKRDTKPNPRLVQLLESSLAPFSAIPADPID